MTTLYSAARAVIESFDKPSPYSPLSDAIERLRDAMNAPRRPLTREFPNPFYIPPAAFPPLPMPDVPNTHLGLPDAYTNGSYSAHLMRAYADEFAAWVLASRAQPPSPPAPSAACASIIKSESAASKQLSGNPGYPDLMPKSVIRKNEITDLVVPIQARAAPPQPPVPEPSADAVREASNDGVICPGCAHQFRAIPVNVQALLLLAGFSPPFLESTAPHAVRDVLAERRRQTEAEGWTLGHDDGHDDGALSMAAAGYALEASEAILNCAHELTGPGEPSLDDVQGGTPSAAVWPAGWEFKPATPRRMLVKAGALILAEIERLDRAALAASSKDQP